MVLGKIMNVVTMKKVLTVKTPSSNGWTLQSYSQPIYWLACLLLVGCTGKQTSVKETPDASFDEQILAVQRGESFEIRSNEPIVNADFEKLHGLDKLQVLSLQNAKLTDTIAPILASLHGLRQLRLEKAIVGDLSADAIANLAGLTTINLPRSNISDRGITRWPVLNELILLRIGSPHLSDGALETFAKLKQLRFLHLIDVPLSDAGLKNLYGMSQLESFYLDGGAATDQGLTELLQALPELHFHRDQEHLPDDPQADDHGKR
jgi:hypothetical protein